MGREGKLRDRDAGHKHMKQKRLISGKIMLPKIVDITLNPDMVRHARLCHVVQSLNHYDRLPSFHKQIKG